MEIINNYSLDSDTSEYMYSNFSNVSEYISSVINKDYIKSKSLYPSVWYRDDVKLETLKKLKMTEDVEVLLQRSEHLHFFHN